MTNEPAQAGSRLPAYTWLPRAAELWSDPATGGPATAPRALVAFLLIGGQVAFTSASVAWGVGAAVAAGLFALAAWPLRRRSARPGTDGAWVERAKAAVRLIRPGRDPDGPALALEVTAQDCAVLDPVRSAAAVRAAARLLTAAGSDPQLLTAAGAAVPEADDAWEPGGSCVVVHDSGTAFVLELDGFGDPDDEQNDGAGPPDDDEDRERQRALLGRVAGTLGVRPPAVHGHFGGVPEELEITADDLRALADAGVASAQRLERGFAASAVDGPSDIALELGRTRAWPSRLDTLPVRTLGAADPERILAVLTEDLAAQAAADRAREERDEAVGPPVTDAWESRWHLYLERYAARPPGAPAPFDLPSGGPRALTPTARAALLLAATADPALRSRAAGPFGLTAAPAARRIPWPRHSRGALVGDRLLLAITVYVVPFTHLWAGTVR